MAYRLQKLVFPSSGAESWTVFGPDGWPVEPVESFLAYLRALERSPNTLRAYGHGLRLFFDFLAEIERDWAEVRLEDLAAFIGWLRRPAVNVIVIDMASSRRSERSVNLILAAVSAFYDYQVTNGCDVADRLVVWRNVASRRYKPFLHHVTKSHPMRTRPVKLKTPSCTPRTLTAEQVQRILDGCDRLRDRFLFALLYETGFRIGQALGLRHEDVHSWDNKIWVVPRSDNANGARAKAVSPYGVDVSPELMGLYVDYLDVEYGDVDSDYVFVNLWAEPYGRPLTYKAVAALVGRLRAKTGVEFTPHMFRHTHVTDLIRNRVRLDLVSERVGHSSIQTTVGIYREVGPEELREELAPYFERRKARP